MSTLLWSQHHCHIHISITIVLAYIVWNLRTGSHKSQKLLKGLQILILDIFLFVGSVTNSCSSDHGIAQVVLFHGDRLWHSCLCINEEWLSSPKILGGVVWSLTAGL